MNNKFKENEQNNELKEVNLNEKDLNIELEKPKHETEEVTAFYNTADEKFYWDEECTKEIEGAPGVLGTINGELKDGTSTYSYFYSCVFNISFTDVPKITI